MIKLLYTILIYLIQPLVVCRLFLKARKLNGSKIKLAERYGFYKKNKSFSEKTIWLHAVSVGETIAAAPFVKKMIEEYPQYKFVVTSMTFTGYLQVKKIFNTDVEHFFVPYDLPGAIHRFLKHINPVIAIFMETELWPNTIAVCKQKKIPIVIANARLSNRSVKGYTKVKSLISQMLNNVDIVAAQYNNDGKNFITLGLSESKIKITGSLKFDIDIPDKIKKQGIELKNYWLMNKPNNTKIIIAVSTHKNEEKIILAVFKRIKKQHKNIMLVVVPRHPERFADVYKLCISHEFKTVRRSFDNEVTANTDIVLADTMGEVPRLLSASDIVFMGGSLVPVGGHNFLEPAALGLVQICGFHVFNFQTIADKLFEAGALLQASDQYELENILCKLLDKPEVCKVMGESALGLIQQEKGSLAKHLKIIRSILNKPSAS